MIVVRMYESLSTTATCVFSSLPPCHYVNVSVSARVCVLLGLQKISGRCDIHIVIYIYIHGIH